MTYLEPVVQLSQVGVGTDIDSGQAKERVIRRSGKRSASVNQVWPRPSDHHLMMSASQYAPGSGLSRTLTI
jgi:hypothetical protein